MPERSLYARVPPGPGIPGVVHVVVEIPKGRRNKFELDKETGLFRLDRYLYSASFYPGDYGFVPQTLAEDGDALDALVMVNEPTFTGCLIAARVIGLFRMRDKGASDAKILAVPHSDPLFSEYRDLSRVPAHFLREVEHFFGTYKQLEGVVVETLGWSGPAEAVDEVERSVARHGAAAAGA
ncbi:MAG: inorganic diphosphatase [Planctomycetota bacterium]|nr:MAG: inorganic diphosphatase [Planctomycetota bacterium]